MGQEEGWNITVNYGYCCSEIKTTKKWHKGGEKYPFPKRVQMEDFFFSFLLATASELQCDGVSGKRFLFKTYESICTFHGVRASDWNCAITWAITITFIRAILAPQIVCWLVEFLLVRVFAAEVKSFRCVTLLTAHLNADHILGQQLDGVFTLGRVVEMSISAVTAVLKMQVADICWKCI